MTSRLEEISDALAERAAAAGRCVVRVEGRSRAPSSGVVWSADGVLVTAQHSVEWEEELSVGLPDGVTATARLVGRDPGTDVAVLRVEASGLETPAWADAAAVRLGQLVLAASRPGHAPRIRAGVLSAVAGEWRSPAGGRLAAYLESDVALHPGFSGGLLSDVAGRGLGLNTAGLLRQTALCVPATTVARVVESLLAHGRLRRGYLGIGTQPVALPPELREHCGQAAALIVLSVQLDSPAARAGLRLGDALLTVEGHPLAQPVDLLGFLDEETVGRELALGLLRAGEHVDVRIVVGERGA